MKTSLLITVVTNKAKYISQNSDEIRAEHYLKALVDLALLKDLDFNKLPQNGLYGYINEIKDLKKNISLKVNDINKFDEKLLELINSSGSYLEGNLIIRRNVADKVDKFYELMETADSIASEDSCDSVTPVHLFTAIVSRPTHVIADLFALFAEDKKSIRNQCSYIEKLGKNITREMKEGMSAKAVARAIESKALVQVIKKNNVRLIMLICENDKTVDTVIGGLIQRIISIEESDDVIPNIDFIVNSGDIIDMTDIKSDEKENSTGEIIESAIIEAARSGNILYIPPFAGEYSDDLASYIALI